MALSNLPSLLTLPALWIMELSGANSLNPTAKSKSTPASITWVDINTFPSTLLLLPLFKLLITLFLSRGSIYEFSRYTSSSLDDNILYRSFEFVIVFTTQRAEPYSLKASTTLSLSSSNLSSLLRDRYLRV